MEYFSELKQIIMLLNFENEEFRIECLMLTYLIIAYNIHVRFRKRISRINMTEQ